MTVCIIGLGLIGGSIAISLRENAFAHRLIGVDFNSNHCTEALALGLVDEILPLHEGIDQAELVIIAIPVDATLEILPSVLNRVNNQVVMDVGSAKLVICNAIRKHEKRSNFVASHPMWGTENNGPLAAVRGAFKNKAAVICDKHLSSDEAIKVVEGVYQTLGMYLVYMGAADHDIHTAYISHVSHITSFALANTVLEKEKEDNTIFELASGGFESTVRLAKSNPKMWLPIFMQNKENVLDVLNEHIYQLKKFKACLEKENVEYLAELMENANTIRRILK